MPNQNGRNMNRGDEGRRNWRPQDMMRDDHDRDFDRDRGDRDRDDWRTDRHGGGQSGYGSGRMGDDRSMGPGYRNQSTWNRGYDDRQGMHTDDRFTGRGGPSYWEDRDTRDYNPERYGAQGGYGGGHGFEDRYGQDRSGYNSGYNRGGTGYGGYGQQGIQQQVGSHQAFRGSGNAGAIDQDFAGRGRYPDEYGPTEGNMGHPGAGDFGQRYPRSMRGGDMGRGQEPSRWGMQGMRGMGGYGAYGGEVGQHRGKGPQGYTRSDDRIRETVCDVLTDDDHIDATHVEVVVKNGEVLLTGTVEDRRMKRMVEDTIERLPGVKDVQNQLRVRGNQDHRGNQERTSAVGKNETETSSTSEKKYRA
jgi:hypothetical protein